MTDVTLWDAMLGYCWPERERMIYLRDFNPALFVRHDQTDDFRLVDPAVAASVAGPLLSITWHGAPDSAVDVG